MNKFCPDCKAELEVDCTDAHGAVSSWKCITCRTYFTIRSSFHSSACFSTLLKSIPSKCTCGAEKYLDEVAKKLQEQITGRKSPRKKKGSSEI